MKNSEVIIIGVAGGSASGKTTVVKKILKSFKDKSLRKVDLDSYYKDFSKLSPAERDAINFDHPNAFDYPVLRENIKDLRAGKTIQKPVYDFATHLRSKETERVAPTRILIIEGILAFADKEIRDLMDLKIFVDAPSDIRLMRRIERDMRERGRSLDSIKNQYFETVRPMHLEFIEPCKLYADIIIPNGGHNHKAISMLVSGINDLLAEK